MEYIQCPHCHKKYGVNDKVRAASGKTIRCKGCQQPFEITIFSTPSPQQAAAGHVEKPQSEQPAPTEEKPAKRPATPKNRHLFQMIYTSVLGTALLVALVVAYQFLNPSASVETSQKQPGKQAAGKKPGQSLTGKQAQQTETARKEVADVQPEEKRGAVATAGMANKPYRGPSNPSNECKEAATDQWFTDYMITNGSMTGREYIRLLDKSSKQTDAVRKLCKEKYLASRITEAAKLGKKPDWIKAEIEARSSSRHETATGRESKF